MVLKTKNLRYADAGFIRLANKYINIELFNASVPVLDLVISEDTCINKICYKKQVFNQKFFKYKYYDDFLSEIILAKPIYDGIKMQKTKNGFIQNIKNLEVDIHYKIENETIIFKDKKQKVYIKINKNLSV